MDLKAGYNETEVGVIPEDWEVRPLSDITDPQRPISYGIVQTGPNILNGIPCLRVLDINDGHINKTNLITTTKQISDAYRRTVVKKKDLVMPLRGKVGDVGIIDDELEGANLTRGVALIAVRPSWSPQFCRQLISWSTNRKRLEQIMNGSALKEISIATLRSFQLGLPSSLSEQRVIAEALSDVDALLGGFDRLIAKKRDLKQATMQQLLTGQIRLPGFHDVWQVKCVGEFTDVTAGGTPSTLIPSYWGGSIRWMSSGELNLKRVEDVLGRITEEGLSNSSTKMIPTKCVLVGLAGQGRTRGTVAMNFVELCINQSVAAILPSSAVVPEYLYYNLDNRYDELRDLSSGEGGRGGLNLTLIKSLPVSLPSILEQTAIAEVLTDMHAEISALEQRREKTRGLKQAMMQELLTGKTRLI
jgi:type I restriction enzyme S subunit